MARASVKASTLAKATAAEKRAQKTIDTFQNFALRLGVGTDNVLSQSTYGFNPVTRLRTILEWCHRGSWMGGIAVDIIADDMTRAGIEINSGLDPSATSKLVKKLNRQWGKINENLKWGSLYGGSLAVMLIDGQDMSMPLRMDTIGPNQFKGLYVLDRWMVEADTNRLVTAFGPDLGKVQFYRVNTDAPALRGQIIHYSRVLRADGADSPYWQKVQENMWSVSVFERLWDRMIALDSATQGAAQLVHKSHLRTYKMKGMTDLVGKGGPGMDTVARKMELISRYQNNNSISLIDGDDDMQVQTSAGYTGISDVILQMAQQISAVIQVPLVRMFGQSPTGMNATGESDLRTYYDGINQRQERRLRDGLESLINVIARSEGIVLGDDFAFEFQPLWEMDEEQKSVVSQRDTESLRSVAESGAISSGDMLRELKQNSRKTGRFDTITDEMIKAADAEPPLLEGLGSLGLSDEELEAAGRDPATVKHDNPNNGPSMAQIARSLDSLPGYGVCGVQVRIENMRGTERSGRGWKVTMPADYGYITGFPSAEGDMEAMDCFVGQNHDSEKAWVFDMVDPRTGKFDEHKVMLGFDTIQEASACIQEAYSDGGMQRVSGKTQMDRGELEAWLRGGDHERPCRLIRSVA